MTWRKSNSTSEKNIKQKDKSSGWGELEPCGESQRNPQCCSSEMRAGRVERST
jgi:hypothetical protein